MGLSGYKQASAWASPVIAFAVKETLGIAVQRLDRVVGVIALLRVVQGHEEGGFLNGVQRQLVLSAAEVGVASVGPRGSARHQDVSEAQHPSQHFLSVDTLHP